MSSTVPAKPGTCYNQGCRKIAFARCAGARYCHYWGIIMSEEAGSATPKLHHNYYLMITHPTEPRILMLPGDSGWALPHFEPEEHFHATGVDLINREARRQLGLEATV